MASIINAATSGGLITTADTSGVLALQTAGTTAVTVDASQNVGVGTSSPSARLHISGTTDATQRIIVNGTGNYSSLKLQYNGTEIGQFQNYQNSEVMIGSTVSAPLYLVTNNTTRATLDSAGNLGLGVTPSAWQSTYKVLQFSSSGALFGETGNTYLGSNIFVNSGGNNTYITTNFASMYRQVDGKHLWYTAASGTAGNSITFTNGMTLNESGRLILGATSIPGSFASTRMYVAQATTVADFSAVFDSTTSTGSNCYGPLIKYTAASPNGTTNEFLICADSTATRFTARSNGGLANYSANNVNLSDRREKTNFAPAKSYLDVICAIPVQTFNYIDQNMEDDGGLTLGVVAQDVQAVAPELVMESNWAIRDEEPKMRLSIYQTDLQYALMKCIQEQQALITQLQADVAALKGATA